MLAKIHAPNRVGQVNVSALTRRVRQYSHQASMAAIAQGVRDFFEDPRNLHRIGDGAPLWRRFLDWYPTEQQRLETKSGVTAALADEWEQESVRSMLKQKGLFDV